MCSSPKLFAAYHVLHRPPMPRHPSCALSSLTTKKLVVSTTSGIAPGSSNSSLQLSLNISCLRGPNINCFMFKLSYNSCRIYFKTFSSIVKTARAEPEFHALFQRQRRQNLARVIENWWSRRDSNPQHPACKAGTLTS